MSKYGHLVASKIVEKTLKFGGQEVKVYFKRLTAGDDLKLARGRKLKGSKSNDSDGFDVELDIGSNRLQKLMRLQLSHCTADGALVFANIEAVEAEDSEIIDALCDLCDESVKADEKPGN